MTRFVRCLPALALCFVVSWLTPIALAADPPPPVTLERIHADPPLEGRLPRGIKLSPGGRFVSYLQPSAADSDVLELWLRPLPAGMPRRLAAAADLVGDHAAALTEAEKMALERRRILKRGITDHDWCGDGDTRIVVALGGDLHLIEVGGDDAQGDGRGARVRRLTFDAAEPERDARCDRAGRQIAFVKRNDLWLLPLDGAGAARRLTTSGSETLSTGLADFIAAEEFDRFDGFWWSKDGRRLLAIEVDDSGVALKSRMQIRAEGSEMTQQRYPAAGERNARLQPLVVEVASGAIERLPLPPSGEYIARAGWFGDGTPWLQWLSRAQNDLQLIEYPAAPTPPRVVLVEAESTWVEVHDDLRELAGWPLSGKPSLLWSSERSGRRQLWQLDRVTGSLRQLTDEAEQVGEVVCADAQRIVYSARRLRDRAQELVVLDRAGGRTSAVDPGPAQRWRSAKADEGCRRLLVSESNWANPPRLRLLSLDGAAPVALDGDGADPLLARLVPAVQSLDLLAADGVTELNAFYLPPLRPSANPAGSAVIVEAYGGPTGRDVGWFWHRGVPRYAHWQGLGFGVLLVDNRGRAGRGRDFSHAHHRAFGKVEVADIFAAVRQLPNKVAGVDAARIGLIGWSYGGFLAARAMLDDDTPFAAAVAGAPVVDWTLYDTAYTERYLGLPEGGAAPPYHDANLALRAATLKKPLMLLHGTSDDNVLFEHSLRLIQALQTEGKLFETVIYPGQTHGLASPALRLHADRASTDFFVRQLRP